MEAPTSKIQEYRQRKSNLWSERSSWMTQWQDISRVLMPRNGRFLSNDRNKGDRKHNNIYDSSAPLALRVLAAGLMAGMTSPARPWFKLETADADLMKFEPVKVWISDVTKLMRQIFNRSNTYRALHMVYTELGGFGTGATIMLDDFDNVIHHYPLTIGEYAIGTNSRGEVDTLFREFDMTVGQMGDYFGTKNLSPATKNLYDARQYDKWVTVNHIIQPRKNHNPVSKLSSEMPFASCYYENGTPDHGKLLRESGFKKFPGMCPRWECTGGDIYGNSPGMEAFGDMKQLQHQQFRKAQGIDYMVKPPLQMPNAMKGVEFNALPGGANYYDGTAQNSIKSAFDVRIDLQHLLMDIQDVRSRIKEIFYTNLFLMLAMNDAPGASRQPVTAREVAERHEEKLLMLGPVLERLHNELLKRMIDSTFDMMIRADILPPPPQEMQGQTLNVEFISMLAQAQRAIGTASVDRYVMAMGQIAQAKPAVLDKFNEDEWADQYGEMLGIDPGLIVANEKVAIIRKQRSEQLAAQQQQAQTAQAAATAKTLSETDTGSENALNDVISRVSGYGGPGLTNAV